MKTIKLTLVTVLALGAFGLTSCKKGCTDEEATNYEEKAKKDDGSCTYTSMLTIELDHGVDGEAITWNDKIYTNAAGNLYSIATLKYYISNITLHGTNGTSDHTEAVVHYRDASDAGTRELTIMDIPVGSYDEISFTFGLDATDNVTGGLDNTAVNNNMEWPDAMGGGYHYMKFEGMYADTSSSTGEASFNIHTGKSMGTDYHFTVTIDSDEIDMEVADGSSFTAHLMMNLNGWFTGDNTYDFNTYGSAIMGNMNAQADIKANGEVGLFMLHHFEEEAASHDH